jgi:hypothetical protein
MFAEDIPPNDDVLCAPCPAGQFQHLEGFLGSACKVWSANCEAQSEAAGAELVEQVAGSATSDYVCKECSQKLEECKAVEVKPLQSSVPGLASGEEIASAGEGSLTGNGGSAVVQTVDAFNGPVASASGDAAAATASVAAGVGLAPTTSFGDGSDTASRGLVTGVPTFLVTVFGDGATGMYVCVCVCICVHVCVWVCDP